MDETKSEYIKTLSVDQMKEKQRLIQKSIDLSNAARVYDQKGDYWKAIDFYLQCITLKREQFGEYSEKVAVPILNLGKQYKKMNQPQKAKECFRKVKVIWERFYDSKHENMRMIQKLLDEPDFPEKDYIRDQHKASSVFNFDPNVKMEARNTDKI